MPHDRILLTYSLSISGGLVNMAQIAASIEYEDAPPPGGLPDDMQAPSGSSLRFLSIKAIDGLQVQAALWQPGGQAAS
jgi:hypothetical protein